MRALVTGGAGFIGSHVVDALLARGDEVAVIDNLSTGREENLRGAIAQGAVLHRADIREPDQVQAVFDAFKPELVFHLAAQIDVRLSVTDPAFDARINVEGTINVLEAARRAGVQRVVNTSTGGAIYGETDELPTPETAEPKPLAAYGQSKFCAERYCGWFERLHGLSTVTVRYGNVFGPRQDPLGEAGVIAIFCGKLQAGETAIIFGDGSQTRDYVYVGDVVAANLAAAEHTEARGEFNVGTGRETSVLEIVEALRTASGDQSFAPTHDPPRLGEVQRSALDVSKARAELGFEAGMDLAEGLRITLESTRPGA